MLMLAWLVCMFFLACSALGAVCGVFYGLYLIVFDRP